MARKKQKTAFIAMTYRGWSRAETAEKAVALLKGEYDTFLKVHGYTVHEVDPKTVVDPLGFGMIYPKGSPPKHVKTVEGTKRLLTKQITKPKRSALEAALADPFAAAAELEVAAANARINKKKTHQEQIMDVNSDAAH